MVAVDNVAATSGCRLSVAPSKSSNSASDAGIRTFKIIKGYIGTIFPVFHGKSASSIGESLLKTTFARMANK